MALTKIPTRTDDSLGRVKYDQRPATDLETQIQASEYNATADAVIAVSKAVGLADGSTPGSLEARMADALARLDDAEACCAETRGRLDAAEGDIEALEEIGAEGRLEALEAVNAGARLDALEGEQARILRASVRWLGGEVGYELRHSVGIVGAEWEPDSVRLTFQEPAGIAQAFISVIGHGTPVVYRASASEWSGGAAVDAWQVDGSGAERIQSPFSFDILIYTRPPATP